jgi:hypothetical protein
MPRPIAVMVLAALEFVGGVFFLLFGIAAIMGPQTISKMMSAFGWSRAMDIQYAPVVRLELAIVFLLAAVLGISTAIGLYKKRNWGRVLAIFGCIIDLIGSGSFTDVFGRLLTVGILLYLLTPTVRSAFTPGGAITRK